MVGTEKLLERERERYDEKEKERNAPPISS